MARTSRNDGKGISLAKGPVGITGAILLVFGVLALIFGDSSFSQNAVDGDIDGKKFLGFEQNGWSALLTAAAGALLLFGSPMHWAAKSLSLIVGLVLGAASLIAIFDKKDVFGIFAANGLTELGWGAAATLLIVLALLPRVGKGKKDDDDDLYGQRDRDRDRGRDRDRDPAADGGDTRRAGAETPARRRLRDRV